jgi:hypothetical protein
MDGDGAAFASLFSRHRDRVFMHSLRLVRTPFEAEDVTAMVFLEAWRCRSRVRLVNDSMLGWLLITAMLAPLISRLSAKMSYSRPRGAGPVMDQEILELLLHLERQLLLHLGGDGLNRVLCRLLTMLVNANSAALRCYR